MTPGKTAGWAALVLATLTFLIVGGVGGCGVYKGWQRGQRRADAQNKVAITHIMIQNANQEAQVVNAQIAATKAEANKRYWEATGIRRAQDEISRTLTPLYIQHEAIQAEEQVATSGQNNTYVYIPSGEGGVPLISATPPVPLHH